MATKALFFQVTIQLLLVGMAVAAALDGGHDQGIFILLLVILQEMKIDNMRR